MGIEERYIYFGFHCFVDFTKAFDTLDLFSGSMVCGQRELRRFQSNYNGMQKSEVYACVFLTGDSSEFLP